jgi:putative membrane protein
MSVIRTSLSLITFGFTIYQVFTRLKGENIASSGVAARNFGSVLVALGIAMLVIGVGYHVQFMLGLRRERQAMAEAGLIHAQSAFPPSMTLITALVLLLIGIAAIASMAFEVGPFF